MNVDECCFEEDSQAADIENPTKRQCLGRKIDPTVLQRTSQVTDLFSVIVPVQYGTRRARFCMSLGDDIAVLKATIEAAFGLPMKRQTLLCGGRELRECDALYTSAPFNTSSRYVVVVTRV